MNASRENRKLQDDGRGWERSALGGLSPSFLAIIAGKIETVLRASGIATPPSNRLEQARRVLESVSSRDDSEPKLVPDPESAALNVSIVAATRAVFEAAAIVDAVISTPNQRAIFDRLRLRQIVKGRLVSDAGQGDDPANRRFETFLAAVMVRGGITVRGGEPDWRLPYYGTELGIAVKRLNVPTVDAAKNLVLKAAEQATRNNIRSLVVLNIEALVEGIPADLDAESFGTVFNGRLKALHDQFDELDKFPHLVGALFTGIVGQWVFPKDAKPQLYFSTPSQLVGFTDVEPFPRFKEYFIDGFAPRFKNGLMEIAKRVDPTTSGPLSGKPVPLWLPESEVVRIRSLLGGRTPY
jgi:hypothetical protein